MKVRKIYPLDIPDLYMGLLIKEESLRIMINIYARRLGDKTVPDVPKGHGYYEMAVNYLIQLTFGIDLLREMHEYFNNGVTNFKGMKREKSVIYDFETN